jgi:hypothetical protein
MADTTFISGVADGAFEKAFGELPDWASEETALAIENTLNKILGVQSKTFAQLLKTATAGGTSLSAKDVENTNKELLKLSKSIGKLVEDSDKAKKQAKSKKDADELELALDKKKSSAGQLWATTLVKLKVASDAILKSQVQYFTTSNDLFKSGVNLLGGQNTSSDSLESLNNIVRDTGLRLETFQKVVEQFSSSINAIGVNKFSQTLKLSRDGLTNLGYNSQQQAELIGTMIESESNYTDLRNKSAQQLTDDAERFGRQVTKLSLFTGQSVSKLQENTKVLSKSNEAWVASARLGPKAADRLVGIASAFGDSNIQDIVLKFGSTMSAANEDIFKSLNAAGLGAEAQELSATFKAGAAGTLSQQETIQRATDIALRIQQQRSKVEALEAQRLGGNAAAGSAETLLAGLTSVGHNLSKATDPQVEAAMKSQAALARLSNALEEKSSLIQRTFPLLTDQVNIASTALETFNKMVKASTDIFSSSTLSWIGIGVQVTSFLLQLGATFWNISSMLKNSFGFIAEIAGTAARGLFSLLNPLAKLAAAFAVGYTIGTVLNEMFGKFNWFINAMDTAFSGLDHILKYIPGFSDDAKHRIEMKEKSVAAEKTPNTNIQKSSIQVPTSPAPSTINSPSAAPIVSENAAEQTSDRFKSTRENTPAATTNKPSQTNEVNSTLTYQTSVLTQILEASQNLVSVNREILKFTRARA